MSESVPSFDFWTGWEHRLFSVYK